jgi:segregation and condensation protein A
LLGVARDWIDLRDILPRAEPGADPRLTRSALASSFAAALELARQGRAEIAQDQVFGPVRLRAAQAPA